MSASPEHFATAMEGFLQEMHRIRDEKVTKAELTLAKDYLTGSFALGFERASRRASHLIALERNGFPPDHVERLLEDFRAVTAADIRRVAREHLHPERTCLSVGGPLSTRDVEKVHKELSG